VVAIPGWSFRGVLVVLQWCLKHRIPVVVMSESTVWDEPRMAWKEAVKRRMVALSSAALVGGKPHKDYMVKLGMPAERVFLGYDAVDNGYFSAKAEEVRSAKCEVRSKFGLPENYFLASARFIEKKNLARLIEAYGLYRKKAQKLKTEILKAGDGNRKSEIWDLVLLGDGALRESLCALRSALGLDACVHLPGFKQYPDLPAYYGLAKAFIHASTKEPWGLVVNEAMASGLPVLVSNRCGCAADLVQEGVNGFTFDPYNIGQLADLMLKISAFNFPLSAFGSESQRIISQWGPDRFAQGLEAAAKCALQVGPKQAGLFDKLLLWALIHRRNA
jgi:glycosyltransferase involved in cell wall biosynthesis